MSVTLQNIAQQLNISIQDVRALLKTFNIKLQDDGELNDEDAELFKKKFANRNFIVNKPSILGSTPENREKTKHEKRFEYELATKSIKADVSWQVFDGSVYTKKRKFNKNTSLNQQNKFVQSNINKKEDEKVKKPKIIELPEIITIQSLIDISKVSVADMMKELIKNGLKLSINDTIDRDTATILMNDLGFEVKETEVEKPLTLQDLIKEDNESVLEPRDPVVVIMGHVDHGKTTLLDTIRKTNIVAKEAGGITQHIGAYQVKHNGRYITFLDTPGHEAFTNIRAKGSSVTDIAVLVVAANDGVMPITKEAINHARAANIPIIVAINKIDIEGVNIDNVKKQLSELDLIPEDWGGDTIMIGISAKQNINIDKLLDIILLVADMRDLKANFNRPAVGTVIESNMDSRFGPVATVIINTGTLKKNDNIVIGPAYGKARIIMDEYGKQLSKAIPSKAVRIAGFDKLPAVGDFLRVFDTIEKCREIATKEYLKRNALYLQSKKISLFDYSSKFSKDGIQVMKVIIKADTEGSLHAITEYVSKIKTEKSYVQIVHSGIGSVTESDIMLAKASDAIILCFGIKSNPLINRLAYKENVVLNYYNIIYELFNDVEKTLLGMVKEELIDVLEGVLYVKKIFATFKDELIIGGYIKEGKIKKGAHVKIIRNNEEIGFGEIVSVQKGKEEVNEMLFDNDCGIKVKTKSNIIAGDIIESYNKYLKEQKILRD